MFSTMTHPQMLAYVRDQMRDTDGVRNFDREIKQAINACIRYWGNRVKVPYSYTFTMSSASAEYLLPSYVRTPLRPQYQNDLDDWVDIATYNIEHRQDGTYLVLPFYRSDEGRVIWWGVNAVGPITTLNLDTGIDADDDGAAFLTDDFAIVSDTGVVQLEDEQIIYQGVVRTSVQLSLQNLDRGAFGTTADSHSMGVDVDWVIVVHREDLFEQMVHFVMARLYMNLLRGGGSGEKESFERMLNFHMAEEQRYWRSYMGLYTPDIRLSKAALGEPLDHRHRWPASGDRWGNP